MDGNLPRHLFTAILPPVERVVPLQKFKSLFEIIALRIIYQPWHPMSLLSGIVEGLTLQVIVDWVSCFRWLPA